MKRRVVVTACGMVSSLGCSINTFWENIKNGKSGINYINSFDTNSLRTKIAAEITKFHPENFLTKKEILRMDKCTQFGVVAALSAIKESRLELDTSDLNKIGIIMGTSLGGINTFRDGCDTLGKMGPDKVSPYFIPMTLSNMISSQIAIKTGINGLNSTISTACTSASNAIGESFRKIKDGYYDVMVCGGAEAPISELGIACFNSMKALSTSEVSPKEASKPFDEQRDGFVIGEGSGVLILEDLNHAIKRQANIYAEIIGFHNNSDAYHITKPKPDFSSISSCMLGALKEGYIKSKNIDYINAHGTGTVLNDKYEALAIKALFGNYDYLLNSTKPLTGHLLGASGGLESIITILAIKNNIVPPMLNLNNPEFKLNYSSNTYTPKTINYALSNSFGFGGQNTSLVFKKYPKME